MTDHQFYIDTGRRLRELRERGLNETPAQFAKRFGLSERDYLAYEEGRRTRGWNRISKLSPPRAYRSTGCSTLTPIMGCSATGEFDGRC